MAEGDSVMLDSIREILRQSRQRDTTDLSVDELYQLLSNERRRAVIRLLGRADGELSVAALAELMADEKGSEARTREYVALHQQHLPRLDEQNIIEYDEREKVVRAGVNLELLGHVHREVKKMVPESSPEDD